MKASKSIQTRDLMRTWRRGDAERMARFMYRSSRGWPHGGGDPEDPRRFERQMREEQLLGAFVAEEGGEIVSYCSLRARPNETKRAYVPLLTADPDYHGKGYGKAVLLRAVERVHELGIERVDLHTWPGNTKAVPLYKKCGFMWSPDSGPWGVHMQNFTPGARHNPIAQQFFQRHDWYRTLKRDLSLAPDEHRRGKARVYEYQWEEDGERLRMVYDRQSWGLVEIETNDLLVACFLDDEKIVAGLPQPICWRIVNRRERPVAVVLVAAADQGVRLDCKRSLEVADAAEIEAEFEVAPDIPEKEREPRAPIIRTDVLVDGVPLTLEAGFQVRQAVQFALHSDGMGLRPGRPERVVIRCENALEKPAEARVQLAASPGVELDTPTASVHLPAKGRAELPVTLHAERPGAAALMLDACAESGGQTVPMKRRELYAYFTDAGAVVGHVEKDRVVLESAALRLSIARRGGWTTVTDKVRNRWDIAGLPAPQIGPPFNWDEFFDTRAEASVEQELGRAVAVLRGRSVYREGLLLERRIALSNQPWVEARDRVLNGTGSPLQLTARRGAEIHTSGGFLAAPTPAGIVRQVSGGAGRSLGEHRLDEEPEQWPEGWMAAEDREGAVVGLLWDRAERVHAHGHHSGVDEALAPAERGEWVASGPLYLFVGDGDYATVRRWWQILFGERRDGEQRRPETRPALTFGLEPRPLVIHGRERAARLGVNCVGRLELSGTLSIHPPEGVRVRPRRAEIERAKAGRRRSRTVTVTRAARAAEGAYPVECAFEIDRAAYRERQWVVVLGDPEQEVRVERAGENRELFRIRNGALALTVAPGFKGSAISLERDGREMLRSSYPEARPLAWANPWCGGIEPRFGGLSSHELTGERFRAREIERRGRQGVVWRGVRVTCSPKTERRRGDRLALDYLLAPGSSIFAVAVRTTRRAGAPGWMDAGFDLWPVLGGSHLDATLFSSADPRAERLRCEFGGDIGGDRWVAAENRRADEAVVVACRGRGTGAGADVYGRDGYCLSAGGGADHEARQTQQSLFFVGFTSPDEARDLAQTLSEFDELP